MKWFRGLLLGLCSLLLTLAISSGWSLQAVQFADGTTQFNSPPRLVDFYTTRDDVNNRNATYYVTVNLLPEAGEPLKTLTVSLTEGRFTRLGYHTDETEVFQGTARDRQSAIPVESVTYTDDTQTLTIQLLEGAQPGQMLTFALHPVRNPTSEGVYLFEVRAASAGDKPVFQRVGTGRLSIFRSDNGEIFP
jgi:hypothetical protein